MLVGGFDIPLVVILFTLAIIVVIILIEVIVILSMLLYYKKLEKACLTSRVKGYLENEKLKKFQKK